jgi:hypothetical protein
MHSPPDWFVAAAAKAGILSIETLHGAHSFFDKDSWPSEQKRSGQITGFVAVSEPLRRHYLRVNPEYPLDRIVTIPNGVDGQQISRGDRARARGSVCGRNSCSHRWRATSCKRTRLGLSTHLPIFSVRVAWLTPCILGKFDDSATDCPAPVKFICAGPALMYRRCWRRLMVLSSITSSKPDFHWRQWRRSAPACQLSLATSLVLTNRWGRADVEGSWLIIPLVIRTRWIGEAWARAVSFSVQSHSSG